MTPSERINLRFCLKVLEADVLPEFGENTSLGTIIRSYTGEDRGILQASQVTLFKECNKPNNSRYADTTREQGPLPEELEADTPADTPAGKQPMRVLRGGESLPALSRYK